MNELTTKNTAGLAKFNFKSAELNRAAESIAAIATNAKNANIELAKVLGHVKETKCYEDDGFKSVAEFAEQTFGIKKATAYQLANVGQRFYNSENETAQLAAQMFSPANLAEIAKMTDDEIAAEIENGMDAETTQDELREIARNHKPATVKAAEKLVNISGTEYHIKTPAKSITADGVKESEFIAARGENSLKAKIKTPGGETVNIILADDGSVTVYTATKVETPKKSKTADRKFTKEELLAMLAELGE